MSPSSFDIAHLASVELFTPTLDETLWYFVDVLGMTENGRQDGAVYLRAYDDYHHHTLKLTPHETTGVGRVGLRAASPEALERRVEVIEAAGFGKGWIDGDLGRGPSYLFADPDGHELPIPPSTRHRPHRQQRIDLVPYNPNVPLGSCQQEDTATIVNL
jgi:catechol 2,3-dioxygenase